MRIISGIPGKRYEDALKVLAEKFVEGHWNGLRDGELLVIQQEKAPSLWLVQARVSPPEFERVFFTNGAEAA